MSLRLKIVLYVVVIHLVLAGAAVVVFMERRPWLLAVEVLLIISVVAGVRLIQSFFVPLDLIRTGAELINEKDFTSKFRETGQREMDQLIQVYNRMIDQLREERTRLREQHYFMDKILAATPSGIITFDFDRRISSVNPAAEKILQVPVEELIGKAMDAFKTPFTESLAALPAGEAQIVPLHGSRRLKCRKSQFLDQGFSRDFIMMEELTEELRLSEKAAYEKLIRMMSHEVNNSVGAINSLLNSCLNYQGQLSEEDRGDYSNALSVAISRSDHLCGFMRRFAEVVRLPNPEPRLCDVGKLLADIRTLMTPELRRRKIEWEWEADGSLPQVLMDKNQMEQVFLNILKNSMEAIGGDGAITLRTGRRGNRPFVMIEDSGPGIPPEVREHLFTPFFSTKANGQGIGLTLIREILLRHGFEFSLDSPPTQFLILF